MDMPILTANQIKMVLKIATVYGQQLNLERSAEIFIVIGGGYTFRAIARQLLDLLPGPGWIIKGSIAYTGTLIVGEAAHNYFIRGGKITPTAFRRFFENVTQKIKARGE